MTDSSASYENIFSEWLAKQVPPAQFSTIHSVFTNINSFCLSRKILKKPLFETDDLVTLSKVRETVESNKIFAFIYRKQKSTMTAAMQHYYRFIKETKDKSSLIEPIRMDKSKNSEQEISASNSLLDFLVANNISFIDNRQKNGCLWMIGGEELKEFADKCSAYGVTFHFKADGAKTTKHSPAWWTTDDFNNSTKREPTVSVADADNVSEDKSSPTASFDKNNRLKFIEWLDKRGVSSSDIFVVLSSLKRCAERVKAEQIINDDIYHVISAETMEAICSFLLADKDFINAERCRGDQFTNALNLYLEFFDEQLTPPIAEVIAEPETGVEPSIGTTIPTVSEIEMLLSEEVFSPLKIALAKENRGLRRRPHGGGRSSGAARCKKGLPSILHILSSRLALGPLLVPYLIIYRMLKSLRGGSPSPSSSPGWGWCRAAWCGHWSGPPGLPDRQWCIHSPGHWSRRSGGGCAG